MDAVVDSSIWVDSPIKEAGAGSAKEDIDKDGALENEKHKEYKEHDEAEQSDQRESLKLGWIKKYAWKAVASGTQGIIERNLLLEKAKAGSSDAVAIRNESYDNGPEPVDGMSEFSSNIGHSSDEQDYPTVPNQRDENLQDDREKLGPHWAQKWAKVGKKTTMGPQSLEDDQTSSFVVSLKSKPVYQGWHAKSMTESSSRSEEKGDVSWSKESKELQLSNESEFNPLLVIIVKELIKLCLSTQKK